MMLFAANDLANPRVVQANLFANGSQRESGLLRFCECFAPGAMCGRRVPLELPLRRLGGFAGSREPGITWHGPQTIGAAAEWCLCAGYH